jgi:pSer/pThr/pTyr-binding forkhead associated (FHA) protein
MAGIVIASGQRRGDRYILGRRTNVIGRAESLSIQILDDLVSRKHVQIRFDPMTRRYSILDMSSKNGVFLNGVRVMDEVPLTHRDRIQIGNTMLLFSERDLDDNTAVLHRFNKPGERQRPTQVDWPAGQQTLRSCLVPVRAGRAVQAVMQS